MGDLNQYQFVLRNKESLSGPFLEIGSRDYGSTQNLRKFFPGEEYIGLDMSQGDGVDIVADLAQSFDTVDEVLGKRRFGTIFSLSVMEHCENPFVMAANMERLLKPGGKLVLSVPFAWRFHGYPSDYWRFTKEGVKKLFPGIAWNEEGGCSWHASNTVDAAIIDENVGLLPLSGKHYRKKGMLLRSLTVDLLKIPRALGLYRWLLGNRYLLLPTMIDMIGVRQEDK